MDKLLREKSESAGLPGPLAMGGQAPVPVWSWRTPRVMLAGLAFLALLVLQTLLSFPLLPQLLRPAVSSHNANANGIGSGIAWHACPDLSEFECGFLSVPMDYAHPSALANETVSLALRRFPATVPKSEYLGTLFTNPGGPGGSGTAYLIERGPALSAILGGRYDVLSWDPRGVNMTTPALDCFPTDYAEWLQEFKQTQLGLPMSTHDSSSGSADANYFLKTEAYYQATVASCAAHGNQKMLQSVSTPYVVRDIVSILDALGERERGLNYWGFSYGTILGATFSAMFPELVHRVVLDGVSDSVLYGNDMFTWGKSGMNDTHKVYDGFLSSCAAAGPARCALAGEGKTAGDIGEAIFALEERLLHAPLPVAFTGLNSGIVTAPDVRFAIFAALYKPKLWPGLAQALAAAIAGDGGKLADLVGFTSLEEMSWRDPVDNVFHRHMTRPLSKPVGNPVSTEAIMCSDTDVSALLPAGEAVPSLTAFKSWSEELARESVTGENWARWIGRCRWWNVTAGEVYRGPWTRDAGLRKTKFPVVFMSMTADPVTPLSAAISMSSGFGSDSATLVINKGYGHCSYAHPSMCVAKTMRKYFFDGVVPAYGTECASDDGFLFPEQGAQAQAQVQVEAMSMSDEDRKIWNALQTLAASEGGEWF